MGADPVREDLPATVKRRLSTDLLARPSPNPCSMRVTSSEEIQTSWAAGVLVGTSAAKAIPAVRPRKASPRTVKSVRCVFIKLFLGILLVIFGFKL